MSCAGIVCVSDIIAFCGGASGEGDVCISRKLYSLHVSRRDSFARHGYFKQESARVGLVSSSNDGFRSSPLD